MLWTTPTGDRLPARVAVAVAVSMAGGATMWGTTGGVDLVRSGTGDNVIYADAGADYIGTSWDHDPVGGDEGTD